MATGDTPLPAEEHQLDGYVSSGSEPGEVTGRRYLYTISEEFLESPRLLRAQQWDNLVLCGSDHEEPTSPIRQAMMSRESAMTSRECNVTSHEGYMMANEEEVPSKGTNGASTHEVESSELEFRMLPSTGPALNERNFTRMFGAQTVTQGFKNVSVQCLDVKSCDCENLKGEVRQLKQMLERAEAEIDYLNEEFRILQDYRGQQCELNMHNRDLPLRTRCQLTVAISYITWIMSGVWDLSRGVWTRLNRT